MYIIDSNQYVIELVVYVSVLLAYFFESIIYMLLVEMLYTEKKMLLNEKHFFPKACILLIHKNIPQEPINVTNSIAY